MFVSHMLRNGPVFANSVMGAHLRILAIEPIYDPLQAAIGRGVHHNGADLAARAAVEIGRAGKFDGGARVFAGH